MFRYVLVPAASLRPALCPAGTSHRKSCSLRSIRRFTHVHPSGLPLARRPRRERERLRILPWASHPAVTHDARQGGDGPADTGPDHTLTKRAPNRCDHSQRATSRRTTSLSSPYLSEQRVNAGHDQTCMGFQITLRKVRSFTSPTENQSTGSDHCSQALHFRRSTC